MAELAAVARVIVSPLPRLFNVRPPATLDRVLALSVVGFFVAERSPALSVITDDVVVSLASLAPRRGSTGTEGFLTAVAVVTLFAALAAVLSVLVLLLTLTALTLRTLLAKLFTLFLLVGRASPPRGEVLALARGERVVPTVLVLSALFTDAVLPRRLRAVAVV